MSALRKVINRATGNGPQPPRSNLIRGLMLGSLAFSLPLHAEPVDIDLSADIGAEYDSNVGVAELDALTNEGDWATTLSLGVEARWTATERVDVKGGLHHDRKDYHNLDKYDLTITRGDIQASYAFRALTLGISRHDAFAHLDQEDFMTFSQTSLFASRLIGQTLYLRGQFAHQTKAFDDQPLRDADNQSWGGDVYWFSRGANTYVSAGLSQESEDARQDNYSYDGFSLKARWSHKLTLADRESQVQLGWRYVKKDFAGPATAPAPDLLGRTTALPDRADRQQHWEARWSLALNRHVTVAAEITYADYGSNFSAADYQETVTALQLQSRF